MRRRCVRCIYLALTLLLPLAGYSAEPILLQGKIDEQQKPAPTWYNSQDPEVLYNQIQLLNQTLTETRRIVKNQEKQLQQYAGDLKDSNNEIESLKKRLNSVKQGKIVEVRDPDLELQLVTANAKIRSLEQDLTETQNALEQAREDAERAIVVETVAPAPVPAPAPAPAPVPVNNPPVDESSELAEMKALVRTYEKAIASLEDELESLREPAETAPVPQMSEPVIEEISEEAPPVDLTPPPAPLAPAPSDPEEEPENVVPSEDLDVRADDLVIPNMEPIVAMAPPAVLNEETPAPSETQIIEDAQQAMDTGDLSRADSLFREALIYNPENVDARLGLASIAYARNKLESASRQVEAILVDHPQQADALGLKGIIHWRAGRSMAAKEFLEQAIALDNQNARLLNFLAIIQDAGGDSEAALATLEQAVSVDPDFPEAHFNLAVIEMMRPLPDKEKATKHYEQSILLGSKRDARLEERLYVDR